MGVNRGISSRMIFPYLFNTANWLQLSLKVVILILIKEGQR